MLEKRESLYTNRINSHKLPTYARMYLQSKQRVYLRTKSVIIGKYELHHILSVCTVSHLHFKRFKQQKLSSEQYATHTAITSMARTSLFPHTRDFKLQTSIYYHFNGCRSELDTHRHVYFQQHRGIKSSILCAHL